MRIVRSKWANSEGWPVRCVAIIDRDSGLSAYRDWLEFARDITKDARTLHRYGVQRQDTGPVRWCAYYTYDGTYIHYAFVMVPEASGFAIYGCFLCLPDPQMDTVSRLLQPQASIPLLFAGRWDRACNAGVLARIV